MNQLFAQFNHHQPKSIKQHITQFNRHENQGPQIASYKPVAHSHGLTNKVQIYMKTGDEQLYRQRQKLAKKSQGTKRSPAPKKKIISKKKKGHDDEQFNVKNQKKDRNVTSNIIHHLIKYLSVTRGPQELIRKILQKSPKIRITFEQFIQNLDGFISKLKTYVTIKHIQKFWFDDNPSMQYFCLLTRILSKIFLKNQCFLSVFFSNKFNRNSKRIHYKGIRNLIESLNKQNLQGCILPQEDGDYN